MKQHQEFQNKTQTGIVYIKQAPLSPKNGQDFMTWSNPVGKTAKHHGFRYFAKTYFLGSENSSKGNKTKIKPYITADDSIRKYKISNVKNENCVQVESNSFLLNTSGFIFNYNETSSTVTSKLNVNGKMNREELNMEAEEYEDPNLKVPKLVTTNSNIKGINSSNKAMGHLPYSFGETKKTKILLTNIPKETGLESIIAQVKGGPLRQILVSNESLFPKSLSEVVLDFLKPGDADEFMHYGKTNLFKVNGLCLNVEWKECELPEYSYFFQSMLPYTFYNDSKVSRCLILKKYSKRRILKRHNKYSENSIVEFDVEDLKRDFSVFGDLQRIVPIISRKLCVSVIYLNIDDAIRAMQNYEDMNSKLHKKYFKTWAMWYGTDSTDQPCIT